MKSQHLRATTPQIVARIIAICACRSAMAQTNTYPWPSSGNVGIGTTTPNAQLEVSGQIRTSGSNPTFSIWGNGQAQVQWNNQGDAANQHFTELIAQGGVFTARFVNDPYNAADNWLYVTRNSGTYTTQSVNFPSGNVGIGTTAPGARLTVHSDAPASIANLDLDSGQDRTPRIQFTGPWSISNQTLPYAQIEVVNDNGGPGAAASASLHFATSSGDPGTLSDKMVLLGSGNVGIGTTSPAARLEVNTGGGATNQTGLYVYHSANSGYSVANFTSNWTDGLGGNLLQVANASGAALTVNSDRNVGIGTANPTYPLTVSGTVRAKEVIVDTGWSDYVFNPGYHLAPLSEVDRIIKTQGHLPGIPTAGDIASVGVNVGEIEAKLLAKIEELTLHEIEQERRLNAQDNEIRELKAEVANLSSRN